MRDTLADSEKSGGKRHGTTISSSGEVVSWEVEGIDPDGPPDTVYVPGFGANRLAHASVIQKLLNDGRRVLHVVGTHGVLKESTEKITNWNIGTIQAQQALALSHALRQENAKGTIIAHSAGALVAAGAAIENLHMFRTMILCAPAGLMQPSLESLFFRGFSEKRRQKEIEKDLDAAVIAHWKEADAHSKNYIKSKRFHALQEARQASRSRIGGALQHLQANGTDVHVIAPTHDNLLPIARNKKEAIRRSGIPEGNLHIIEGGTHSSHIHAPELVVEIIRKILHTQKQ